jgi:colanic acid biosynthesis glycosyl transferase WcaI
LRILLYGLNYSPELTGIGKYSGELGDWLIARGHEVRVVTAPPYYPAWRIDPPYRGNDYRREHGPNDSIVYRCPLYVPQVPNGLRRMAHLFSFAISSVPVMMNLASWGPDVIIMVEPTFFCAPVALFAGVMAAAPCWLHVQDFEVNAAFDLGLLPKGGWMEAFAIRLEGYLTRRFAGVSSISPRMLERIRNKHVPHDRVFLFPNWVDIHEVRPMEGVTSYRRELGLEGKLVLLYAGNLGNKQGLEILDPLCDSFRGDSRVHFLVCGEGSLRNSLEAFAKPHPNLTLLPLQPLERLNELLNTADIHLLPQRPGAGDLMMPSKLTGMLATGRPVISTAEPGTQVARVVGGDPELGAEPTGLLVPPGDVEAFRAAIFLLLENGELRQRFGAAARRHAIEYLGKQAILQRFEQDLRQLVESAKG